MVEVQFYTNEYSGIWRLYDAKERDTVGTWNRIHAPKSHFFTMNNPYDMGELRAHVLPDGKTCGELIDACEASNRKWGSIGSAMDKMLAKAKA